MTTTRQDTAQPTAPWLAIVSASDAAGDLFLDVTADDLLALLDIAANQADVMDAEDAEDAADALGVTPERLSTLFDQAARITAAIRAAQ